MIAEGIHRLEPPFSAAERLSRKVDSQWEGHKDRGNAAFQAGDWDSAIAHYSDGHFVANGSLEDSFDAVLDALSDHPQGSPQNQVSGNQQLACKLFGYMGRQVGILRFDHGGVKMEAQQPNRPASICLANRAFAKEKAGLLQESLEDALRAAVLCPEYEKAHHRVKTAHRALAESAADPAEKKRHLKEAKKKQQQLKDYKQALAILPCAETAMLVAGLIQHQEMIMVYMPERQAEIFRRILAEQSRDDYFGSPVHVTASLVPFQGGQWLLIGVRYVSGNGTPKQIDSAEFVPVDNRNGDDLERPPNGFASAAALQHVPQLLLKFVAELTDALGGGGLGGGAVRASEGPLVATIMLGQGLVQHCQAVQGHIREGEPAKFGHLVVHPATSTSASEDHIARAMGLPTKTERMVQAVREGAGNK
jgi:tetratricopeptide (TPR) repeat protein